MSKVRASSAKKPDSLKNKEKYRYQCWIRLPIWPHRHGRSGRFQYSGTAFQGPGHQYPYQDSIRTQSVFLFCLSRRTAEKCTANNFCSGPPDPASAGSVPEQNHRRTPQYQRYRYRQIDRDAGRRYGETGLRYSVFHHVFHRRRPAYHRQFRLCHQACKDTRGGVFQSTWRYGILYRPGLYLGEYANRTFMRLPGRSDRPTGQLHRLPPLFGYSLQGLCRQFFCHGCLRRFLYHRRRPQRLDVDTEAETDPLSAGRKSTVEASTW